MENINYKLDQFEGPLDLLLTLISKNKIDINDIPIADLCSQYMEYINAFIVGGLICALAQILMEKTKMMPGRIMVLLVVTGAVISFMGWYEPFMEFAGAGASVPLLGFGNILMKGVKEAVDEKGFLGLFTGGFKAGAVGSSAALIFGYLASLIFKPKMKG